ncbi:hypothetical protein HK097_003329 [Rhizophlyctis rosea]|uniref:TauD/TfdA-like domain-containing protein n=1 Tax=Rhizophlyctis rosea TaxID=64517 RepID=A0AAD5X304_9FUNG|nr:hypothetical protein HK097_003329 [Rhizophlyctis rosea]
MLVGQQPQPAHTLADNLKQPIINFAKPETTGAGYIPAEALLTVSDIPAKIEDRSDWYGPELEKQPELWKYWLTSSDVEEILTATNTFIDSGVDVALITKEKFSLPTLAPKLAQYRDELLNGRGFILIRGLPTHTLTRHQQIVAFTGLGTYLGEMVPQNQKGHVLGHVKDIGHDAQKPETRFYATHEQQRFHTDGCDTVGLLCLQVSEEGGKSKVASSTRVWNQLSQERPDLAQVLLQYFYWDRKDEVVEGEAGYGLAPIAYYFKNRFMLHYDRNFLRTAARHANVPALTPIQLEAIDYLEATAEKNCLRMELNVGDIQFVHNHQILHARTSFRDSAEKTRHLLRLWLSTGGIGGWDLPWDPQGSRKRGGVHVKVQRETVPLEAE